MVQQNTFLCMINVYDDLQSWLERIKKPQKKLDGFSICPFAKLLPHIVICDKLDSKTIESNLSTSLTIFLEKQNKTSFEELKNLCIKLNLKHKDYTFLPDHPDHVTTIQNIPTGNGKYPLIIMQSKKELMHARASLNKSSYYSYWSDEYLEEIKGY